MGLVVDVRQILSVDVELSVGMSQEIGAKHGHLDVLPHGKLLPNPANGQGGGTLLVLKVPGKKQIEFKFPERVPLLYLPRRQSVASLGSFRIKEGRF